MSIKVIPKFLLKNYIDENEWDDIDHFEESLTLCEYIEQIEDFPEEALINKVKEQFNALLTWEFEGQTKVIIDNNRENYTLMRERTSEAQFKQLLDEFNAYEYGILKDENARFGTGFIYLDIVPNSYNVNIN